MLARLVESTERANPDMVATTYGVLLRGGSKVRLTNVERIDEHVLADWTAVCKSYGYHIRVQSGVRGYVTLFLQPEHQHDWTPVLWCAVCVLLFLKIVI